MSYEIRVGHCIDEMRKMDAESVHCVVTSIPYWGLREYGVPPSVWGGDESCEHVFGAEIVETHSAKRGTDKGLIDGGKGQIEAGRFAKRSSFCTRCNAWRGCLGLEPDFRMFIDHIVLVFREVWRVLRKDGTVWLNIGDCYATAAGSTNSPGGGERGSKWTGTPAPGATSWANGRELKRQRMGDAGTSSARPVMGKHAVRKAGPPSSSSTLRGNGHVGGGPKMSALEPTYMPVGPTSQPNRMPQPGLKAKDRVMMPARIAIALCDDGWFLRDEIIWAKPNPMPESTRDRTTKAHEQIFLLAKSGRTLLWNHRDGRWTHKRPEADYIWRHRKERYEQAWPPLDDHAKEFVRINLWAGYDYYYDRRAIAEPASANTHSRIKMPDGWDTGAGGHGSYHRNGREHGATFGRQARMAGVHPKSAPNGSMIRAKDSWHESTTDVLDTRNKRSVWTVGTEAFADAHFATFPTKLIEPCILAGCPPGGTVLDPFGGSGTTAVVAERHGRNTVLIELNPAYAEMADRRVKQDIPPLVAGMTGTAETTEQMGLFGEAAE